MAAVMPAVTFHAAFHAGALKPLHRDHLPSEPKGYRDLKGHIFERQFREAIQVEIEAVQRHGTWRPVSRPTAHGKVLPLTWVFKYKLNKQGLVTKFKARICVRGDLQFWNDEDTYAATLAARSFRLLMALTAKFDLETRQLDAVNAFTNSPLDEEIYVDWPPGYKNASNSRECLRLHKALYGLRRSPLLWYRSISSALLRLGLQAVPEEACTFKNDWLIVFFYVDDIVLLYRRKDAKRTEAFITGIKALYEINDLGEL